MGIGPVTKEEMERTAGAVCCLWCRDYVVQANQCLKGETIQDSKKQVCELWRGVV